MTEPYVSITVPKKYRSAYAKYGKKYKSVIMVLIAFQLMKDFVNLVKVLKMNTMC